MKIYLSSKGLRPDIDNAPIINTVIAKAKDKDIIIVPDGNFPIDAAIEQTNKGLRWEGNGRTEIMVGLAVNAMILKTNISQSDTFITGIDFNNHYGGVDNNSDQHGIICSVILNMSYCSVRNFWGHGIVMSADINSLGNGSNCSFSELRKVSCSGNRRSGIYFQGGDANACGIWMADTRDNGEWGICDSSFLGNNFHSCMAHSNGKGNYCTTDVNNRSNFFGCYSEGGSPPDSFAGVTNWFGGFPPADVFLYDRACYWYANQILYADKNNPGKYLTRWNN